MRPATVSPTIQERIESSSDSSPARSFSDPTSNHARIRWSGPDRATPSGENLFESKIRTATSNSLVLLLPPDTAANESPPHTEHFRIRDLGEAGYGVRRSIPVVVTRIGIGDYEASFREANIAMSGSDPDDAYQSLVAEILDTFDVLGRERKLGPDAAEQRRTLQRYIVRT